LQVQRHRVVNLAADLLRLEVAHQGVTVSCLHPSWIDTDMVRDGDAESRAFARLRAAMRPPMSKTHPVETIVAPIVDAVEARAPRVFLPGFVRVAYFMRNALNAGPGLRDLLQAAPEMRQLFAEQAEQQGVRTASLGSRWDH